MVCRLGIIRLAAPVPMPGALAPVLVADQQDCCTPVGIASAVGGALFYPKDDTAGLYLSSRRITFLDDFAVLKILGAEVLGVTWMILRHTAEFAQAQAVAIPLLADKDGNAVAASDEVATCWITRIAKRNTFRLIRRADRAHLRGRIRPRTLGGHRRTTAAVRQAVAPVGA